MSILKIILIDVSMSLAIAGLGALLVASCLGTLERWRIAILARPQSGVRGVASPTRIAASDSSYTSEVNVRMVAEGVIFKPRSEGVAASTYGPSGLLRVQAHRRKRFATGPGRAKARSIRRFETGAANQRTSVRTFRSRKALPEYADGK